MSVEYFCRLLPHLMDELPNLYDNWCGYYYQGSNKCVYICYLPLYFLAPPWRLNKLVKAILLSFQVLRRHPGEE